jgi:SAM-dependent methyltransferase
MAAIDEFTADDPTTIKVVDFGCGKGNLVSKLRKRGVAAWGCDVDPYWDGNPAYLKPIEQEPYRIPFDDNSIDIVLSTSVLEHAQTSEVLFNEIKRVLKPGGCAFHIYPSKWYLPKEPHIYVPLVNWFWPNVPRWWLALWAILGTRNEFQENLDWRQVTELNAEYCKTGICYRTKRYYRDTSLKVFGNCDWPMHFFLDNSDGGVASLYRRFPIKWPIVWACERFRMVLLVNRKSPDGSM